MLQPLHSHRAPGRLAAARSPLVSRLVRTLIRNLPLGVLLGLAGGLGTAQCAAQSAAHSPSGEDLPTPQMGEPAGQPNSPPRSSSTGRRPSTAACPDCPPHHGSHPTADRHWDRRDSDHGLARRIDWTQAPSTYTHNAYGQRVDQYSPGVQPTVAQQTNYQQSGYRHTRSNLAYGGSVDNLHIVEEWGRPVRPYGEWLYPNRPFAVPYSQWGPQPVITPWGVWPGMGGPGWPGGGGGALPGPPAGPGGQPGAGGGWNWPTPLPGEVDSDWPLGVGG